MGRIEQIFIKRVKRGPMDPADRATLIAGRGIVGNANQGGMRQVTLLSSERWAELMQGLSADLDPRARRANLLVSGIDFRETRGRTLIIGGCRLLVRGETRPCEQMEQALPGLQELMRNPWAGGAFAEVIDGGDIVVGDLVRWEP
jgi:MOSC domain-containing protein YiiM